MSPACAASSFALCLLLALTASVLPVFAQNSEWYSLEVPGGRQTLTALGVSERRERAAVMVELIRRLHFSTHPPSPLEAGLRDLLKVTGGRVDRTALASDASALHLPLPLPPQIWSATVFGRDVPPRRLFAEILNDPAARLLFHGLAGMDPETRRWMSGQPELIRRLYRNEDAVRSFAMFGPALKLVGGQIAIPGGDVAERRWSSALGVDAHRPDRFIGRLFEHNSGRTAGLYFTIAVVDGPRRAFLLNANDRTNDGDARFGRLVTGFADCYPSNATTYPFLVRSHDAALLLLEIGIDSNGALAGPQPRHFWERVLEGGELQDSAAADRQASKRDAPVDAAWMVDALCHAATEQRGGVFDALLAGHRVFAGTTGDALAEVAIALRARRLYPSVFMALEHAGIRHGRVYAAVARHAAGLARLDDAERASTALRQFQGTLAMTLNATAANTVTSSQAERLVESLAAVPFENERYDGRLADWFDRAWLPAMRASFAADGHVASVERAVAAALAGPIQTPPRVVRWEGLDYIVDLSGSERDRLLDVRKRQGGVTLDSVMDLSRIAGRLGVPGLTVQEVGTLANAVRDLHARIGSVPGADEFAGQGPDVAAELSEAAIALSRIDSPRELGRVARVGADLAPAIDFLFAHAVASWAYAAHVGAADGGALVGGDASLRHDLGLRSTGRAKVLQRWQVSISGDDGRAIAGSLLGLQGAMAKWSLRRLSNDAVPSRPTIGGNDLASFMLTAALSNPRHLTDDDLDRLSAATAAGTKVIAAARSDPVRLRAAATEAAMSPWRRETLSWLAEHEGERLDEQFSLTELARLGGLSAERLAAWGAASFMTGCLCLQMPRLRIPEATLGRAADGILGGLSADLMLRIATLLSELKMPAALAAPVLRYAMRDFLDQVTPAHAADFDAFARQARVLDRLTVEDYLGAIAAVGPLRPAVVR